MPRIKEMSDYTIRLANLPCTIRAFVEMRDDYYTVVVNANLSRETQIKAAKHEIYEHILHNDFDSDCEVDEIELTAHGIK